MWSLRRLISLRTIAPQWLLSVTTSSTRVSAAASFYSSSHTLRSSKQQHKLPRGPMCVQQPIASGAGVGVAACLYGGNLPAKDMPAVGAWTWLAQLPMALPSLLTTVTPTPPTSVRGPTRTLLARPRCEASSELSLVIMLIVVGHPPSSMHE